MTLFAHLFRRSHGLGEVWLRLGLATVLCTIALLSTRAHGDDEVDMKLVLRARSEVETLWRKGFVLGDQELDSTLQAILDDVTSGVTVPPKISLRVQVFRSPEVNAFALPDGSIFVFTGLLAQLTSRDQLAFVLAHEAQHAIALHGQKYVQQAKSKSTALGILSIVGSVGLAASGMTYAGLIDAFAQLGLALVATASIHGYGRDLERNADEVGLQLMRSANYDGCGAVESMHVLLSRHDDASRTSNFFWGRHPLLRDRIDDLNTDLGTTCDPDSFELVESYATIKWPMVKRSIALWLMSQRSRDALDVALEYKNVFPEDPEIHCHLGDIYTAIATTNQDVASMDTLKIAVESYETALDLAESDFRRPFRGLHTVAEAQGDTASTIHYLREYLADDAPVPYRRSLRRKLRKLEAAFESSTVAR